MPLRTAAEYVESLRDGRTVWYRGRRVEDVTAEPDLRVAIDHAALDFELAHSDCYRHLAVATDGETHQQYSAYYRIPRTPEDLRDRGRLIEYATSVGGTLVTLVKEIGSDALFGLLRVLDGEGLERAEAYLERCRDEDLAVAVAQTDVKGDRSKPPHAQDDPDLYVHVVEEQPDGIVVRGAKCHTSVSMNANEIVVLPTRAMCPDDADCAVAFAVPVDTPGLSLYASGYGAGPRPEFEFPVSSKHAMVETLTVFDDVFVPWERVFACGQPQLAGAIALAFVEHHRFTAVSYKLPLVDALVGSAALIADMNGVANTAHVRDKLAQLVAYAETVRALTEMAAIRARCGQRGIAVPDPLTTNLAKLTFATGYHRALELVQDCAGGLLVTAPGADDWLNPEVRTVLEKYFRAAGSAEARLRLMHAISDLTTRDFGGYQSVLAVHAEGSIEAEKLQMFRSYDASRAIDYARSLAGIDGIEG
jgi:4-hydroxybutyryl-CoA dehydratase / vinylacetyl-CoA-Delta-isomerase